MLVVAALVVVGLVVNPDTAQGGLPCLWLSLFDWDCVGCGLTRAGALLLRGRVLDALAMNMLIVPVASMAVWVVVRDVAWQR